MDDNMTLPPSFSPFTVEDLCLKITEKRRLKYAAKSEGYPRSNPIASDISDCVRETVYGITHWKERPKFSPELTARFERGSKIEDWIIQELQELGYKVRVDRKAFEMRDKDGRLILRGRIDGFLSSDGREFPFECKSLNPNVYQQINSQEDFDRYIFFRKYPRQLQTYLFSEEKEEGFWILDDCMGHWKLIPCRLDYDRMEAILKHLETAVKHVVNRTLPDYHTDPSVCLKCWAFKTVCMPPFFSGEGMKLIEDPELEQKLNRHAELDPLASEYDKLDKELKFLFKGKDGLIVGNWLVSGEEKVRHYKSQPAKEAYETKFWQVSFDRVDEKGNVEDRLTPVTSSG